MLAVDKKQGALDVICAAEDARRFRKQQLKTVCSRDDRIAALIGELQLGSAASEDGDDEPEAQAGSVLSDAERSRVPTAEASVIESLHSSLDVFLYAERMAQSAEVDASRVGAFVAHAESQLPSRRGARAAAAAPVPVAAPATGGARNPPATHADEAPPQMQQLKRRAPLEPSARAAVPPPAAAAAPLAPLPAAPAALPQSSTRTAAVAARPARPAREPAMTAPPRPPPWPLSRLDSPSAELTAEELRLEASLHRLDSALEAKRLNSAGSGLSSRGGLGSGRVRAVSAPAWPAACGNACGNACGSACGNACGSACGSACGNVGSRLAGRLRMVTAAAAAACAGIDTVPCKAHGLVPCKLCSAAALRPPRPQSGPSRRAVAPQPPTPSFVQPPPSRRVRSAGATSYTALRVAREVHAVRSGAMRPQLSEQSPRRGEHSPPPAPTDHAAHSAPSPPEQQQALPPVPPQSAQDYSHAYMQACMQQQQWAAYHYQQQWQQYLHDPQKLYRQQESP